MISILAVGAIAWVACYAAGHSHHPAVRAWLEPLPLSPAVSAPLMIAAYVAVFAASERLR